MTILTIIRFLTIILIRDFMTIDLRILRIGMNLDLHHKVFFPRSKTKGVHPRKGESVVRNVDSEISETMGGSWGRGRNKYNDRGSKITVQRKNSFINKSTCKQSNFRENSRELRIHSKGLDTGVIRDHKSNTTSFFYSLHETEKEWEKTSHNRSFRI